MDAIVRSTVASSDAPRGSPGIRQHAISLKKAVFEGLTLRIIAAGCDAQRLERDAVSCVNIAISGVLYKPRDRAQGDSNIIFTHPDLQHSVPGSIREIFLHRRIQDGKDVEETFLVVNRLLELSAEEAQLDPFRRFKAGGSLYYDNYFKNIYVIKTSDVLCHAARTAMHDLVLPGLKGGDDLAEDSFDKKFVHIKPLDRVRALRLCGAAKTHTQHDR